METPHIVTLKEEGKPEYDRKIAEDNEVPRLSESSIDSGRKERKPEYDRKIVKGNEVPRLSESLIDTKERKLEFDRNIANDARLKSSIRHASSENSIWENDKWNDKRDRAYKGLNVTGSSTSSSSSSIYESGNSSTDSALVEDFLNVFNDKLQFGQKLDASSDKVMGEINPQGREESAGLLNELVEKMRSTQLETQGDAVLQLRSLTRSSSENREILCHPDLLAALVPLLESATSSVQINSVVAILNLSLEKGNKLKITRAGIVLPLINVLKKGHPESQEHAAAVIFSLAMNDDNKMALGVLGAITPLMNIMKSSRSSLRGRNDAAMALSYLAMAPMNRSKMVKAGLVPVLLGVAKEENGELSIQAMRTLSCLASSQEGRSTLLELKGISVLLSMIEQSKKRDLSEQEKLKEHAMATLLSLSLKNMRFKPLALEARALDILAPEKERGTPRAQEKCLALLKILTEPRARSDHSSGPLFGSTQFPRSYVPRETTVNRAYVPRNSERTDPQTEKAQTSYF
ncbi:hypothetical protein O6H91_03G041700 [Diphasiastrum complanatum]|nr:hypothetical protein O6H91_03G023800 [Diphasiastrum complanatum]KAJ7561801.1 hypothetical protein O6H91_03G041700 [Diphasiastrum complanatum]